LIVISFFPCLLDLMSRLLTRTLELYRGDPDMRETLMSNPTTVSQYGRTGF